MNIILCENTYYESNWCKQILNGLKSKLKARRIEYKIIFSSSEIKNDDILFIIGSDYNWISQSVLKANILRITPIVIFNQLNHIIEGRYHSVSSDINGSIRAITHWLKKENKKNICLYGVNPASISDISRSQSYLHASSEHYHTFFNNGSLKECFKSFIESKEMFDAAICTNDFTAISLVKNLLEQNPDMLNNMNIISCSQSSISKYYTEHIKSININLTSLGTNAYEVAHIAARGENISEISLTVKWDMNFNTENIPTSALQTNFDSEIFYGDDELSTLLMLDRLIEHCDELDNQIIHLLLANKTYFDIAEICHISEQSVKYRVKQYIEICKLQNRKEFISLLSEYHLSI